MRNSKIIVSILSSTAAVALTLAGSPASAQQVPLTLDPGGGAPPAAPAPAGPAAGGGGYAGAGVDYSAGEGAAPGAEAEAPENFYYGDYLDDDADDAGFRPAKRNNGAVPATHTVQSGDTL
jgi:hypothetical protein